LRLQRLQPITTRLQPTSLINVILNAKITYFLKMPNHLSEDLKWRVVYLWLDGHKPKEISQLLYISEPTAKRILHYYKLWMCVNNPFKRNRGRSRIFSDNDMNVCLYFFII